MTGVQTCALPIYAMRTKKFYAKKESRFAEDCMLVQWDRENQTPDGKLKIKDTYHSDICDAVLYGFREALHYLYEPEPVETKPYSSKWFKEQEDEMWEKALEKQRELEEFDEKIYQNDDF